MDKYGVIDQRTPPEDEPSDGQPDARDSDEKRAADRLAQHPATRAGRAVTDRVRSSDRSR